MACWHLNITTQHSQCNDLQRFQHSILSIECMIGLNRSGHVRQITPLSHRVKKDATDMAQRCSVLTCSIQARNQPLRSPSLTETNSDSEVTSSQAFRNGLRMIGTRWTSQQFQQPIPLPNDKNNAGCPPGW